MRNYKYSLQQMRRLHGLREDADAKAINVARRSYHEFVREGISEMFWKKDMTRLDATATNILALELEHASSRIHDFQFPEYLAETLFPGPQESYPEGAETWSYELYTPTAMAQWLGSAGTEIARVSVTGEKFTGSFKTMALGYGWTLNELKAIMLKGGQLSVKKAKATRHGVAAKRDQVFAFGDDETGLPGALNHPNIPIVSSGITGDWANATPQQMLADLYIIERYTPNSTKNVFRTDTLILPTEEYQIASATMLSNDNSKTVLAQFKENASYIKEVKDWNLLDTADAAGTGPRAMAMANDGDAIELVSSVQYQEMPPERKGFSWTVDAYSTIGGTKVPKPLAHVYCDLA